MILSLQSIQTDGNRRHFFCNVDDLESGFEVLSRLAVQGDRVLEAHILEETGRLDLPPEIFDGQPFRRPIRRLKKQWTRILNKPVGKGSVHNLEVKANVHRLITIQQEQLSHNQACIDRLISLQDRARQIISDVRWQVQVIDRYQMLIDAHQVSSKRVDACRELNQHRLKRL